MHRTNGLRDSEQCVLWRLTSVTKRCEKTDV